MLSPVKARSDKVARQKSRCVGLYSCVCSTLRFQQSRLSQGCQKISFHLSKAFAHNGLAGHQHELDRLRQLMLMQEEGLSQQPPRSAAHHRIAYFRSEE